jgi:Holliday junction resolvase RusA-like endonuclease
MIELEIKGKPQPWAAHQGYGRRSYDPRAAYKKTSRMQIRAQYKGPIIEEAVYLAFFFYLPIPKSTSEKKAQKILKDRLCHITKPDTSNLTKCHEDILKGIVLKDDNQVTMLKASKEYSLNPRTVICIIPMSELIPSKL